MNKKLYTALISVALVAGSCLAGPTLYEGQKYEAHDSSPALRVHYSGSGNCTIAVTNDNALIAVTVDSGLSTSCANSLDCTGTGIDTIAELAAAIEACTNTAGKKLLTVDTKCVGATSESMDEELLVAEQTQRGPGWFDGVLWDTSDTKHYRVYIPPSGKGADRKNVFVDSVYGSIGGTGNVTITGYIDSTEVYKRQYESPLYRLGANTGGTATGQVTIVSYIMAGEIDFPLGLVAGKDQGIMLQAARATSGTTGGIGIRLKYE